VVYQKFQKKLAVYLCGLPVSSLFIVTKKPPGNACMLVGQGIYSAKIAIKLTKLLVKITGCPVVGIQWPVIRPRLHHVARF